MSPSPIFWVASLAMLVACALYWLALRETACLSFPQGWKKVLTRVKEYIRETGMEQNPWRANRLARVLSYEKFCAQRQRLPRYYRKADGFYFAGQMLPVQSLDEKAFRKMAKQANKFFK